MSGFTKASEIVESLDIMRQKAQALQAPSQSITVVNGPLIVVGQGPFSEIIRGFADLTTVGTVACARQQGMKSLASGADSDSVLDAYKSYARVYQQLLETLIGKAGLFKTVPFVGQPVVAALRQQEAVVDSITFGLIDKTASRASDIQTSGESLGQTMTTAISAYDGVTVA